MPHEILFDADEKAFSAFCIISFTTDSEWSCGHRGRHSQRGEEVNRMSQETLFQESQALYAAYFFAADGE